MCLCKFPTLPGHGLSACAPFRQSDPTRLVVSPGISWKPGATTVPLSPRVRLSMPQTGGAQGLREGQQLVLRQPGEAEPGCNPAVTHSSAWSRCHCSCGEAGSGIPKAGFWDCPSVPRPGTQEGQGRSRKPGEMAVWGGALLRPAHPWVLWVPVASARECAKKRTLGLTGRQV